MTKVSIIIPSRNEEHLSRMVKDVFAKGVGDIEVIVVVDGPTNFPLPKQQPKLKFIIKQQPEGMRAAINSAVKIAKGKFFLKADAHCAFPLGFDEILKNDCDDNWVVTARRFTLDPNSWQPKPHMPIDYFYLSCPWNNPRFFQMQACPWTSKTKGRVNNYPVDDQMTFQGSMWFMSSKHFEKCIQSMNQKDYGSLYCEHLEIGMKTWLSGGRVVINKKTWYAHLHKAGLERGYRVRSKELYRSHGFAARYWTENKWPKRIHDFDWLISKFWPLPTQDTLHYGEKYYWPKNWRGYL